MAQTLVKSWWLALCGVFDALFAVMIFLASPDGSPNLRTFMHSRNGITQLGVLALAAGVCTIAAGVWSSRKDNSWLLVLSGLACSSLGLLVTLGATRPIAFRTIALVIVVMAVSIGLYELATVRTLRGASHRRMASWRCGSGLGWFRRGVSCFRASLDQTRSKSIGADLPLAWLLFRFHRDLYGGAGSAPERPTGSH
jgi:uncharacterized membrane protein HdeD (DUF308 family)